jgi:NAD-dependent deacetylase
MIEPLSAKDRVFVLTGAGVSAESGLPTFRGAGGIWRGYRAQDVATPEAFHANLRWCGSSTRSAASGTRA